MIPKPGKISKKQINHRPISILKTMSKALEIFLLDRSKLWIKMRPDEHRSRFHHSTTMKVINVTDQLDKQCKQKTKNSSCCIRYRKIIWQFIAWWRDLQANPKWHILSLKNIVASFIFERSFQIKIENKISTSTTINSGVL